MSIETQIARIKGNIAAAYAKAAEKGAAMPTKQDSRNLPAAIASISGDGSGVSGLCTVSAAANNTEWGTASGGGQVSAGMTVTLTARPADKCRFEGWQEAESVVHTGLDYTFPVSGSRALTAVFAENLYEPGADWWSVELPYSGWSDIIYAGGKFVAGMNTTKIAISIDGVNWTVKSVPSHIDLIAYGNGKFIATSGYAVLCSTNGETWTEAQSYLTSGINIHCNAIAYGDGKFVVVGMSAEPNITKYAYYSMDGINWNSMTLPVSSKWWGIAYGDGKFVAVGGQSSVVYSANGVDWIKSSIPSTGASADSYWKAVAYGDGKFVVVAFQSTKAAYSTDGVTWKETKLPISAKWRDITYGNGKFVAIAYRVAAYSTDGVNWTQVDLPFSSNWQCIAYGAEKFVALTPDSKKAAYSSYAPPVA